MAQERLAHVLGSSQQHKCEDYYQALRSEIKDLKMTIQELREQVPNSPNRSWAAVAAGTASASPIALKTPPATGKSGTVTVILDTSNTDSTTLPISTSAVDIKERAKTAFTSNPETAGIEVKGVQWGNKGRLVLILGTESQHAAAYEHREWINTFAPGAKRLREKWYPIKCDGVYKAGIVKEDGWTLRDDIHKMIEEENTRPEGPPIQVRKVKWLSQQSNRRAGSLVIYLSSQEMADNLLQRQVIEIGGQGAFTKPYLRIPQPDRCYKCCQYGHVQRNCRLSPQCGKCAGPRHFKECNSPIIKCAVCQGDHMVTNRNCPEYKKQLERLQAYSNIIPPDQPTC